MPEACVSEEPVLCSCSSRSQKSAPTDLWHPLAYMWDRSMKASESFGEPEVDATRNKLLEREEDSGRLHTPSSFFFFSAIF